MPCPFRTAATMVDIDPFQIIPCDHSTETRHARLKLYFVCWLACRCGGMEPYDIDRLLDGKHSRDGIKDPRVHTWVSYVPKSPDFSNTQILATFITMYVRWLDENVQPPPALSHVRSHAFREWLRLIKPSAAIKSTADKLLTVLGKAQPHDPK